MSPDAILRVVRVPAEFEGTRLDRFLSLQLRATSRTRAQAIIEASAYSPDGRKLRASDRLRTEQRIYLWRPGFEETPPASEPVILYEDDHLIVVDKPPLMTVHPTARHHHQTVLKYLEHIRPGEYLSLIHRLDRDTSGVLLVARSPAADRAFKMQLEERSIAAARAAEAGGPVGKADKIYWAITWGVPPEGLIDRALEDDPSPLRVKMRVAPSGLGLAARTGVRVLATHGGYAFVECELFTGRQHQIRVHLASVGTPVVGDKLYGPDERLLARSADGELSEEDERLLELPRHALHAHRYRVNHCFTGELIEFAAPLPVDLAEFWASRGGSALEMHTPG
ncbi:MAG TPA: RluA family pseudouridine synthase [Polyangiaceae bacterium]|nr:RluA family pseudouridine synthase [Polyangiaceae bacterium]